MINNKPTTQKIIECFEKALREAKKIDQEASDEASKHQEILDKLGQIEKEVAEIKKAII